MAKLCSRIIVLGVAVFLAAQVISCGASRRAKNPSQYIREYKLGNLPRFDIPVVINERVVAWMQYFQGPGRRHFERYLRRSGRYIPMMHKILREKGLPRDLVYIALIESGYNNNARSHANAVGNWQFIRSTGKIYKLKIDGWVDERRDPIKATHAAANFYKDLFDEFGHWYLAMAGYNAGPGRVRRAIKRAGSRNFWDLANHRRALRPETRDYVPKFIAAAIMAKMPERFGFKDIDYHEPLEYDTSTVETQTDLEVIAKCAGVKYEEIIDLNAHLIRGATPPSVRHYTIKLPKGTAKKFELAYAELPKDERIQVVRHRVKRGETLSRIARRYGVSVSMIKAANNIRNARRLRKGRTLVIPKGAAAARYMAKAKKRGSSRTTKLITHRVRKGETAGGIARRYGVRLSKLKSWNGLNRRARIRVGQRLKIYRRVAKGGGGTKVARGKATKHKVKRGETLGGIARRYGVSTKTLMAWNGIKNPKRVRAGKVLKVGVSKKKSPSKSNTTAISLAELDVETTSKSKSKPKVSKRHKVRRGQTLGGIARRYGVSTKTLMAWNGIKNPKRVRAGQTLVVGKTSASKSKSASKTSSKSTKSASSSTKYKLKNGETLGHVAEKFGVSTKKLMAWNGIKNPRRVRSGRTLIVKGAKLPIEKETASKPIKLVPGNVAKKKKISSFVYRVRNGDTLWGIARKHKVTIAQLQKWNSLADPSSVRPGTKLTIYRN